MNNLNNNLFLTRMEEQVEVRNVIEWHYEFVFDIRLFVLLISTVKSCQNFGKAEQFIAFIFDIDHFHAKQIKFANC